MEYLVSVAKEGFDKNSAQSRRGLDELAEKLRSMAQTHESNATQWRPDPRDPFSFSATIMRALEDDSQHTVVRGQLDTGCEENWISMDVLTRAGLESQLKSHDSAGTYTAFGGEEFEPIGKIEITWYAENAAKSRTTNFLVHGKVPFDMVLGRIWIAEESIFVFNKPALALRMGNFTKGITVPNICTQEH